jgi:tRNA-binding protein
MVEIQYTDFQKVEMRIGKIVEVLDFPEARKASYKLRIDFGKDIGVKNSGAQITKLYKKEELVGRLVVGVVNFPVKRIAGFSSEVLTLGVPDREGNVVLLKPDFDAELGVSVF